MIEAMTAVDIAQFFADHYRTSGDTLWRLETLPSYDVGSDGPNYQLWLQGAPEPDPVWKGEWLDTLRREHADGLRSGRTRILGTPGGNLTAYERYACEFGYALNVPAGEGVRVIRRGEHPIPKGILEVDFWLVNSTHVIVMNYDEYGRFVDADLVDDTKPYITTRELLRDAGEPFPAWWARHAELRRHLAT